MAHRESKQDQPGLISRRSDIPPLFMLHVLEDTRSNVDAKVISKFLRREMSRQEAFFRLHPVLGVLTVLLAGCSLALLLSP